MQAAVERSRSLLERRGGLSHGFYNPAMPLREGRHAIAAKCSCAG